MITNTNLKDNVKGNSTFEYYRDSSLWYKTETGLVFPIPVSDIDQGQFRATEKSLHFMRWIKKYLKTLSET
jgi:hypothetical protein